MSYNVSAKRVIRSANKTLAVIESITLNAATFSGEVIVPTLINFFYGNNGTGKSTIARAINANDGLTWKQGKSNEDYSVLVYNHDFVNANFQGYGDLKGVYTLGEQNIDIQNKVAQKSQQKAELDRQLAENTAEKDRKRIAKSALLSTFQEDCWDRTKALREAFDATQGGYKRKALFAEMVLQIASPVQHDLDALKGLYSTAFDANARVYKEFQPLCVDIACSNALLSKPITSSSDTPFAGFIKALNATDWVRHGHDRFTINAHGKCPYCQQELPGDFESQITACFDAQYQQDIDSLRQFQADYASDMNGCLNVLRANLQDAYPKLDLAEYKDKFALFEKMTELNIKKIADKMKEPSSVVSLENVETLLEELNELIAGFNRRIQENNFVVRVKQQKQEECKIKVWELIAYSLQSVVSAYKANLSELESGIEILTQLVCDGRLASQALERDIGDLNRKIVSTAPAVQSINDLLRDSGFQGFSLREKRCQQNTYEVVRSNGSVAENLSEGEHNFIAFLYFYHLVRGSDNNSGTSKDKIVVIDDPVSSMDSSALFIISTLVREMVELCYNNADYLKKWVKGDYIKQIFVLTHNPYFHREITHNQIHRYKYVSFFVVNKTNNLSSVRLCERCSLKIPTEMENYNPVQNSYAALWREYKEADTAIEVLNVIRRILDYYFVQLSGYDGGDIRQRVLEDSRDVFVDTMTDEPDYAKYHIASAMLSYINTGVSDGLNYIDDCTDVAQYKAVFKLIFEVLQQEQHYKMMMG